MAKTFRVESYERFKEMIEEGQLQLIEPFYKNIIIRRAKEMNRPWEIVDDGFVNDFPLKSEWLENLQQMSPEQYRREYFGEWVVDDSTNLIDKKILRDLHKFRRNRR